MESARGLGAVDFFLGFAGMSGSWLTATYSKLASPRMLE